MAVVCRQSKDKMKISHRQQFSLAIYQPDSGRHTLAFGTMAVATRIISNMDMGTVLTARNMPAKFSGATTYSGAHELQVF
jgi:hypothetical protein